MNKDDDARPSGIAHNADIIGRLHLAASVFEHAHDIILIADRNARIVEVNRAFTLITGYTADEVRGRKPGLLKSGLHLPEFYETLWTAVRRDGVWRGEIWNRRKNGEIYVELLTIYSVNRQEGQVGHYVGIYANIAHPKEYQQRLERMAHFDSLTQLPNRILFAD